MIVSPLISIRFFSFMLVGSMIVSPLISIRFFSFMPTKLPTTKVFPSLRIVQVIGKWAWTAFMVTARVALEGLWASFALLVVTTKPLLSAAALTPTALGLTSPLYLMAFRLVRLQGSVEKGFLTPLFLSRKQELSLMIPHAISDETFMVTSLKKCIQAV